MSKIMVASNSSSTASSTYSDNPLSPKLANSFSIASLITSAAQQQHQQQQAQLHLNSTESQSNMFGSNVSINSNSSSNPSSNLNSQQIIGNDQVSITSSASSTSSAISDQNNYEYYQTGLELKPQATDLLHGYTKLEGSIINYFLSLRY
jgi:hypothetical protein